MGGDLKGESVGRVGGDRGVVVDAFEGFNVRREMDESAVKGVSSYFSWSIPVIGSIYRAAGDGFKRAEGLSPSSCLRQMYLQRSCQRQVLGRVKC